MRSTMAGILVIVFCLGFTCRSNVIFQQGQDMYEVIRIDSLNDYYLIYSKKNDSIFKIVANKPLIKAKKCNKIQTGSSYPFFLNSYLDNLPGGFEYLSPKINPQINCLSFDESTSICVEVGMVRDLFFAVNLSGLCFVGKTNIGR